MSVLSSFESECNGRRTTALLLTPIAWHPALPRSPAAHHYLKHMYTRHQLLTSGIRSRSLRYAMSHNTSALGIQRHQSLKGNGEVPLTRLCQDMDEVQNATCARADKRPPKLCQQSSSGNRSQPEQGRARMEIMHSVLSI